MPSDWQQVIGVSIRTISGCDNEDIKYKASK
jgi:hypothetical protein